MKIKGVLVDIMVQVYQEKYGPNVVYEKVNKVLNLEVLRAIYGMLQSALLSYNNLIKYLETDGFKFNPYDQCMSNKIIEREMLTEVFHVDDVKASHRDKNVVKN